MRLRHIIILQNKIDLVRLSLSLYVSLPFSLLYLPLTVSCR